MSIYTSEIEVTLWDPEEEGEYASLILEVEWDLEYEPEEGDGWNEPYRPEHREIHVLSATLYERDYVKGGEGEYRLSLKDLDNMGVLEDVVSACEAEIEGHIENAMVSAYESRMDDGGYDYDGPWC